MTTSNSQNKIEWEKRAELLRDNLNSVLLKNTPYILNQHLHNWHRRIILQHLKEERRALRVLDVGCGYGRLSAELLDNFANINIIGIDLSQTFAKLYKETLKRPAVIGTVNDIPLSHGHFDLIICVTVLMFVEADNLQKALNNLMACLKEKGSLIIIENDRSGAPFLSGFGLAGIFKNYFNKTNVQTKDYYFKRGQIRDLILKMGGTIKSEHRLPATTLCFLLLQFVSRLLPRRFTTRLLTIFTALDELLSKSKLLPSMWVAYVAEGGQNRRHKE